MNKISNPNAHATIIAFNRHEFAGAFGDIGTDLPLLTGVIIAANLEPSGILTCFGILLILTGLYYRIPMPIQPMKAMAALVIAQGIGLETIAGAGIAIAIIVLILTITGLLQKIAELVPPSVVRGIQVGLGLKLSLLALTRYIP
ncbi:MAG: transporter, partial [Lentisphaerae bacterium]